MEWNTSNSVFFAYEPGLAEISEEITFMYGLDECPYTPDRTLVRPETAAQALREYVETGKRPTCVEWQEA